MQTDPNLLPAPRLQVTAWLSAPARPLESAVAAQLRMSMFRRVEAVIVSAIASQIMALLAVSRHPTPAFVTWLVLDATLLSLRLPIAIYILRRVKGDRHGGLFGPWATDLFIIAGTLWSGLMGFGFLLCVMSDDSSLIIVMTFMATAIMAAQSIRNPSSPRMNQVQMGLILLPFSVGALFSAVPLVSWGALLGPVYLITMSNLTRQIHDDYVAMIVAQLENHRRALHCPLTGLPNRSFFDDSLRGALRHAVDSKQTLSVLCIDLDGFKQVNDRFGHPLGDALLVQVADRLKRLIRKTDVVARLGGDEFAILMRAAGRSDAEEIASRINRVMAEPFTLSPHVTATIGASLGIVALDGGSGADVTDLDLIMARADRALYAAKHAGKCTFRGYDERTAPFPFPASQERGLRLVG